MATRIITWDDFIMRNNTPVSEEIQEAHTMYTYLMDRYFAGGPTIPYAQYINWEASKTAEFKAGHSTKSLMLTFFTELAIAYRSCE
jgi:hypothetical protein